MDLASRAVSGARATDDFRIDRHPRLGAAFEVRGRAPQPTRNQIRRRGHHGILNMKAYLCRGSIKEMAVTLMFGYTEIMQLNV